MSLRIKNSLPHLLKNSHNDGLTLVQFQTLESSPPLGALYLSYALEKENIPFDLRIYPKFELRIDLDHLYSFLAQSHRILAIGCWSNVLPYLVVTLDKIKRKFPEKIIILGGIGPSIVAEEMIQSFPFIDYVIKGCGIFPFPRLVRKILNKDRDFSDIAGLVYRKQKNWVANQAANFYPPGDSYDHPSYRKLENIHQYTEFHIRTSFGCPFQCSYCQLSSLSGREVVYRGLSPIIDEIKFLKRAHSQGNFSIVFADEVFNLKRERVIDFCHLLREETLNIPWACNCRVEQMDEALLQIMSQTGCINIYYGLESGSNRILKKIKKGFSIDPAIKTVLLSQKYIGSITASFIYLYPFETAEDFKETLLVIRYLESKGIKIQLHPLTPIKNSAIYEAYRKNLRLIKDMVNSCHVPVGTMPRECQNIIRDYPEVFYYYYTYDFGGLSEILRIAGIK